MTSGSSFSQERGERFPPLPREQGGRTVRLWQQPIRLYSEVLPFMREGQVIISTRSAYSIILWNWPPSSREFTTDMMNLLYVTIKAILNPHIEDRLVRCIYELRTMVIQGVMPQLFQCAGCGRELTEEENGELFFSQDEHGILCADCSRMAMDRKRISAAALYAMRYIAVSPLAKLYTFTVRDDVLRELERHIYRYTELNTDKRFKSLEILELMR